MKALRLETLPAAETARTSAKPAASVLAQRRSTLGGGSAAAPPILDSGRPLEPATRNEMERGFGQDFGAIRIHDDARAHDNARSMGALAYAAGNDIVFGEGRYAPETAAGRALIAHELAHSVQQGGVQMKSEGPLSPTADARLEAEADGAALAITSGRPVPALSRVSAPGLFRAGDPPPVAPTPVIAPAASDSTATGTPAAAADTKSVSPGPVPGLPSDVKLIEEAPEGPGATMIIVSMPVLVLPRVKGKGKWVQQAYTTMANGKRLIFSPIFDGKTYETSKTIAAFMEKPGEKYKDIWLQSHGFTSLQGLVKTFRDTAVGDPEVKAVVEKPEVKKIFDVFAATNKLTNSGCDIDHIVEKQIGGTSVPGNLQLLMSDKNQESGRQTYASMVAEVKRILEPNRPKVTQLQIRFEKAEVKDDDPDASFEIETLLRTNKVTGSADVKKKGEGSPLMLLAGGAPEIINVKASGPTPIPPSEKRLIPGMRLIQYIRTNGSTATKGVDKIEAELASKPMLPGDKAITLSATVAPAPAAPAADPAAPAVATTAPVAAVPGEVRKLTLDPTKNKDLPFYYPYLSKGKLTSLTVDSEGKFSGTGVIYPTVKFFGDIHFKFTPNDIEAIANIPIDKLKTPGKNWFRFTESTLGLKLAPTLVPSGEVKFSVGLASSPVATGSISVSVKDGAVVGTGSLTPTGKIPGITAAKGEVGYNSNTGWSGKITASSAAIPNSTVTAELGFYEKDGNVVPYAKGGITTQVRGAELFLKLGWGGEYVSYWGSVRIPKPLPLVSSVTISGSYGNGLLSLDGEAPIVWNNFSAKMKVYYTRKDGDQDGKFSGTADVAIVTDKADGTINLSFNEKGLLKGSGSLTYKLTKDIKPKLGVDIGEDGRIKLSGGVDLADMEFGKMWPGPKGGETPIIKGIGVKFDVPTPVWGVTAYGQIKGSLGVRYGVGPVTLKGVKLTGELYPFEADPAIKATLTGKLVLPAFGELYGTFGAYIGVDILWGVAGGAKGGIEATPSLRVDGLVGLDVNAAYDSGGFSFGAVAYAEGGMMARIKVNFAAEIYALSGAYTYRWTYPLAAAEKPLGPRLKVTLGKIAYSPSAGMTWPSLEQIKLEPADFHPLDMVKSLMSEGKAT